MKAQELYAKLEEDFDLAHCKDDWSQMDFNEFTSENFKRRYMGLMADNASEIKKVYTAVFPSEAVINHILAHGKKDAMLFIHHPMIWDIDGNNGVFRNIPRVAFERLRENHIAIYALHTPLDKTGDYCTGISLATALNIKKEKDFYEYFGNPAGIIGTTKLKTIDLLAKKAMVAVGHKVKIWAYGPKEITDGRVALIAGGGNDINALQEMVDLGVNTFVTGVTRPTREYKPAIEAHEYAKEHKINIIGATHYSTEKFACIAILDYFQKLGLKAEFVPDKPDYEDMDYGFRG